MKFNNEVFLQMEHSREVLNLINYLAALMGMDFLINLTWFRTNKRRVKRWGLSASWEASHSSKNLSCSIRPATY
jgi:hypothetical protein